MRLGAFVCLLTLLYSYPAFADDKRDLILQMLEVTEGKKNHEAAVQAYVDQFSKNPITNTKEFRAYFDEVMSWDGLLEPTIEIYRESYTEDELRALIAFFQSPIGRSFVRKMPEVSRKSTAVVMGRIQKAMHHLEKQ